MFGLMNEGGEGGTYAAVGEAVGAAVGLLGACVCVYVCGR